MTFGSTTGGSILPRPAGISDGQLKQQAVAIGASPNNCVVVTRTELDHLKNIAAGAAAGNAESASTSRDRRAALAAERKAHLQQIDEERRSKGIVRPIDEIEREAQRKEDIKAARSKLDEDIDEVKYMNKVMLYAKCVTVRDAQVQEKGAIKSEKQEEERKRDIMMETERLKALRMYEERELKRIEDRKKGAAVIRAQIEEREQERLRKLEIKQQEQDAMLRHIERMKEDDQLEAVKKKEAAKRLMAEVALANAEQIRLKNHQREMEQEEDRLIAQYIKDKESRENDIVEEQERVKTDKEREIARLRSMQEKAQDKRAELDALRARRAQQAYEREHRQKEREAAARAAAINMDLSQARETQKAEKERQLTEQAQLEKEEFERIIAVQKEEEESEKSRHEKERELSRRHAEQLRKQIEEIEEQRKKERREFLESGAKLKADKRERESLVESIRQKKKSELEALGVPKQYCQELLKRKSNEPLRPAA